MNKKHLHYIDFLKALGLTAIMIAHVNPPSMLFALRSFDVPLMVIISSYLAQKSYRKYRATNSGILDYYKTRFARLIFPTWIFLIIYFVIIELVTKNTYSFEYYLKSFLLTRYGIGYVWIMLIYLYSALLVPLIDKMGYSIKAIATVAFCYLLYEILYYFHIGTNNMFIETTFYYVVPYGLLTYIGYNLNKIKNKRLILLIAINLLAFVALALYSYTKTGSFQQVQTAKYPPRLYYLSYGILCSLILMTVCSNGKYEKYFKNRVIHFMSSHSMWIYLWHILVLSAYQKLQLPENWILELLVVFTCAILIVIIVNKILDALEKKKHFKIYDYLRG